MVNAHRRAPSAVTGFLRREQAFQRGPPRRGDAVAIRRAGCRVRTSRLQGRADASGGRPSCRAFRFEPLPRDVYDDHFAARAVTGSPARSRDARKGTEGEQAADRDDRERRRRRQRGRPPGPAPRQPAERAAGRRRPRARARVSVAASPALNATIRTSPSATWCCAIAASSTTSADGHGTSPAEAPIAASPRHVMRSGWW